MKKFVVYREGPCVSFSHQGNWDGQSFFEVFSLVMFKLAPYFRSFLCYIRTLQFLKVRIYAHKVAFKNRSEENARVSENSRYYPADC